VSESLPPIRVRGLGKKGINMATFTLNGGYSYSGGIEVDADTIDEAAELWYDRWSSNGLRRVEGVLWPCFGDMEFDDYAVINYDTEETLTRREVMELMEV
tara:strand:+ start:155 stop:454 length:300 start_codon:yes stop_codon:yes gene_type:complete